MTSSGLIRLAMYFLPSMRKPTNLKAAMIQTKRNHNFSTMDEDEAARVRAAWKPVIEKLPDYAYLCDEILREAQENEEENDIDLQ